MKLVVFSDVHGRSDRVAELLKLHRNADAFLFLGDGIRDLPQDIHSLPSCFAGVRGNCDFSFGNILDFSLAEELLLNFGSYTVMMTHGHLYGVKSGIDSAVRHAAVRHADILLYGHTHVAEERFLPEGTAIEGITLSKPMWIMNPGSLGAPRNGKASYGLVQIRNEQILLSHGTLL